MIYRIKYAIVQFTCDIITDVLKFIKIDSLSKVHRFVDDTDQLSYFFIVFLFVLTLYKSWHLEVIGHTWTFKFVIFWVETDALARTQINRNMFQNDRDFFFSYNLVKFNIVKTKSYQLFLTSLAHKDSYKEIDKLIMINSLVSIFIDLFDESST
jgi:hypothetical protein